VPETTIPLDASIALLPILTCQDSLRGGRVKMASVADGYVLQPGEGRVIDLGGFSMSVKATDEESDGMFALLEAQEPPHFGPPLHIHHGITEAFYVLEGEYVIFIRDTETRCPAGSFIFIPAETPHGFRVGEVASRKLNLYLPAAMVGYFDDLSEAMKNGDVDPERRSEIATRHSLEVIGPVPEGYI
jgi:mannose-6-phosphate isomerase-like protein (cupin superfamily)